MLLQQTAENKLINESTLRTGSFTSPAITPLVIVWTANTVFHCIMMFFPSAYTSMAKWDFQKYMGK